MPTTTNFSWTTPTVGGSAGTWGTILNDAITAIDSSLNTVKTTADAAMPKAGGTFTGNVGLKTATMVTSDLGSVSGATELDIADADYFEITKSGATTISFANWPADGKAEFVVLHVFHDSVAGLVWPSEVDWDGASAPTQQIAGEQVFLFWSVDGGTQVYGKLVYTNTSL